MGSANYVGRVGALAVALGIGAAVANSPGIAVAAPADSDSSASSPGSSADSSSAASTPSSGDASPSSNSPDASTESASHPDSTAEPRSGIVQSSGGAPTSTTTPESDATAPVPDRDLSVGDELTVTTPVEPVTDTPNGPGADVRDTSSVQLVRDSDNEQPADPAPSAPEVTVEASQSPGHPAARISTPVAADEEAPPPAPQPVVAPLSTNSANVVAAAAVPAATSAQLATPADVVTRIVPSLLTWVGLSPALTTTPATPVAPPLVWAVLAWVRRQFEQTFANQTPTIAYNPAQNSQSTGGVVTGDLTPSDPENDPLTFGVTRNPQHGAVVVNPDGTFRYTPQPDFAQTGGIDTFTVRVTDNTGSLLHALARIVNPAFHTTEATVTVTVNAPPAIGNPAFTIETVNPTTGVVEGTVNITDPDDDTLTFSLTTPSANGAVTVDPATGNWTYTPTLNARLKATDINATAADKQTTFTITGTDGVTATAVTVTASVQPLSVTTIPVGSFPRSVAISPDGTRAYVGSSLDDSVAVIDTATNTVIATIPLEDPDAVAVSPDGSYAYVATQGTLGDTLSVIDTATNSVVGTINLPSFVEDDGLVFSPDGAHAYVVTASGNVLVINNTTHTVVDAIQVGFIGQHIAASPDGNRIYVTSGVGHVVTVIDATTNSVLTTIDVDPTGDDLEIRTAGVAVSPDSTRAYVVINRFDDVEASVAVIDTATNTVIDSIVVGGRPLNVAVDPDGTRIYVTNTFISGTIPTDTLQVIDTATNTVISTILVGPSPNDVVVSPDGDQVFVANDPGSSVTVIALSSA